MLLEVHLAIRAEISKVISILQLSDDERLCDIPQRKLGHHSYGVVYLRTKVSRGYGASVVFARYRGVTNQSR